MNDLTNESFSDDGGIYTNFFIEKLDRRSGREEKGNLSLCVDIPYPRSATVASGRAFRLQSVNL